jgi:hypothetical protein
LQQHGVLGGQMGWQVAAHGVFSWLPCALEAVSL